MILLDTNVLSENFRPRPNTLVRDWVDAQPESTLYICSPVLAELRFGVERLAAERKQTNLRAAIDKLEEDVYFGRILPFDAAAAAAYGRLAAARERAGRRMELVDAMIAAVAFTHRATLATRDINDFADLGLDLINPFEVGASTK